MISPTRDPSWYQSIPGWRPIDQAPKDGTPILGVGYQNGEMATVAWHEVKGNQGWWSLCVTGGPYVDDCEWEPDYWLPLPERPGPF